MVSQGATHFGSSVRLREVVGNIGYWMLDRCAFGLWKLAKTIKTPLSVPLKQGNRLRYHQSHRVMELYSHKVIVSSSHKVMKSFPRHIQGENKGASNAFRTSHSNGVVVRFNDVFYNRKP